MLTIKKNFKLIFNFRVKFHWKHFNRGHELNSDVNQY